MGVLLSSFFPKLIFKEARILMVGLDSAGKTTILYRLKLGEVITSIPTIGFNVETVQFHNIHFTVWDIGGQHKIRSLWRHYYDGSQGLIFVVDSCDKGRLGEASRELRGILEDEKMRDTVVLVLANKQDMAGALPVGEVVEGLGLKELKVKWCIQGTCGITGDGLDKGLTWLGDNLKL
uniref:ADP-ribosylation factor n=1 Tax=Arcella intermedia TaxID=1963864 RepID=A0A6B2LM73_9EUKA